MIGVAAAAVAGWMLAPARGSGWATAGGSLLWLGAAIYGVGIAGWATPITSEPTERARPWLLSALVDHVNDDAARMLAVPSAAPLSPSIGSLS